MNIRKRLPLVATFLAAAALGTALVGARPARAQLDIGR
ncbi:hypothetical protein A7982_13420 [Minicystis rosea]|nr:hypothetical protein A7982_13420 [Minicystis rosea]